ncbi:DNA repair protein rhp7 [Cladorrhinum sp. PSN259]|nr:DNA repair protein rhp7 [Cladorrhinum sp. PSN259]
MGPQSALTDFLASHNISAHQIRQDVEARRRAAAQSNPDNADNADDQENDQDDADGEDSVAQEVSPADEEVTASPARTARTRRGAQAEAQRKKEQQAIEKIKASKKLKKRKRGHDENSDEEDEIIRALAQERAKPLPGQMENCAQCGKRFTVTAYSRNSPEGGLLCTPCGKELDKEAGAPKKKVKQASGGAVGRRRQVQSKILDGTYTLGGKSLMTLCIETLAKNIDLAEDLGDLPISVIDKIARKLSRHRLMNSTTLSLFLQPSAEEVYIYDASKLNSHDFIRVFQTVPNLKKLKVRNGIHFKDEVMDYLISRNIELTDLYLHGSNLISEDKWKEFIQKKGHSLKSLHVYWTDKHFTDEVARVIRDTCKSLEKVKICHNQKLTETGAIELAYIESLRHLSLDMREPVTPDGYIEALKGRGAELQTLSLTRVPELDNSVLDFMHHTCRSLKKLRITDCDLVTDSGFVRLFTDWANPGLVFLDLQKCRLLEQTRNRENPDNVGLCSKGFRALMEHSGKTLKHLNVHGCRHIKASAFEDVFSADKRYEEMEKMEISFCEEVTDFVVGSIFRSCPNLRELNVFGCMKVKDVRVPRGKILVGVPNARGMVIEGDDD